MSKDIKKINWLNFIAIIIAIISLGFSLFKVVPNSTFNNDTFIGVIAAFIGISVTLLIGYQIFNVVEVREKIKKLDGMDNFMNYLSHLTDGNSLLDQSLSATRMATAIKDKISPFKYTELLTSHIPLFNASLYEFLQSDISKVDIAILQINSIASGNTKIDFTDDQSNNISNRYNYIIRHPNYPIIATRYKAMYDNLCNHSNIQ